MSTSRKISSNSLPVFSHKLHLFFWLQQDCTVWDTQLHHCEHKVTKKTIDRVQCQDSRKVERQDSNKRLPSIPSLDATPYALHEAASQSNLEKKRPNSCCMSNQDLLNTSTYIRVRRLLTPQNSHNLLRMFFFFISREHFLFCYPCIKYNLREGQPVIPPIILSGLEEFLLSLDPQN